MKTDPFWKDLFARRRAKLEAKEITWIALLAALTGAPFFIFFYAQDDPGRAMVAAIVVGLFFVTIRRYWHLRDRPWFIITIGVLIAFHVALVLLIPWVDTGYHGVVLGPMAVPDLLLIYGSIRLVGKLVREPNLNEPVTDVSEFTEN